MTLTGGFDAVVQVGVQTVNAILAAQHEIQRPEQIYFHSLSTVVDDVATAGTDPIPPAERTGVRGFAEVQVSAPSISLPAGPGGSRVTVHAELRARFIPDPGSPSFPEYVHGDLAATVDVSQVSSALGDVLVFNFGAADLAVSFTPVRGAELSTADADRVTRVLRNVMRTRLGPVNERLPAIGDRPGLAVRSVRFKTLPGATSTDPRAAVAALLTLPGGGAGRPDPGAVTERLIGGPEELAIGVSRELLVASLQRAIADGPLEFDVPLDQDLPFPLGRVRATYRVALDPRSFSLELLEREQRLVLTFNGRATTNDEVSAVVFGVRLFRVRLPNVAFSVRQTLRLDLPGGVPELGADGPPQVRIRLTDLNPLLELFRVPLEAIISRVLPDRLAPRRDELVRSAGASLRAVLDAGRVVRPFLDALRVPVRSFAYSAIRIRSDGLVLRGRLVPQAPRTIQVGFRTTSYGDELEFDALESWIAGGNIRRYTWIVPVTDGTSPTLDRRVAEEHRFVTRVRPRPNEGSQWCLQVDGSRLGARVDGRTDVVCGIGMPTPGLLEAVLSAPFDRLVLDVRYFLPGPQPDPAPDVLIAHYDPWLAGIVERGNTSTLVHFADPQSLDGLAAIGDALGRSSRKESPVFVAAVLSPEQLAKARPPSARDNVAFAVTADSEGTWRKAFQVGEVPATFLVDPEGKVAWQKIGQLEPATLAAALDQHLAADGWLRWQMPALALRPGASAPDFLFPYAEGQQIGLRKLRGRPVLLAFWTSWSEPCLAELRSLQSRYGQSADDGPIVLAINDGEPAERADEAFKAHGLSFQLVPDPNREVARLYGVSCWPTVVSIDQSGFVERVHLGRTPRG